MRRHGFPVTTVWCDDCDPPCTACGTLTHYPTLILPGGTAVVGYRDAAFVQSALSKVGSKGKG